ncbi:MAG: terminase small subunit, partial [Burkholderiales bacterium]|nr:terminase small subunit [Burkholderiales bacterium]
MAKLVNKAELSELLGYSERTISSWQGEDNGFPVVSRGERGEENVYDAPAVVAWLLQREAARWGGESQEARRRLVSAQASRAELELQRRQGALVSAEEVRLGARATAREVRDALLAIPDRLAPALVSIRDAATMRQALAGEIGKAL